MNMPGQRVDPYKNYNFLVEINGVASAGFSSCLLPESSIEIVEYREGSDSTNAVRKLPGRTRYSNLVLKRGITASHDLWTWYENLVKGTVDRRDVTVILLDESRNPVQKWTFRNAWPTKYETSPLHAKGGEVAIETLELAHELMELA